MAIFQRVRRCSSPYATPLVYTFPSSTYSTFPLSNHPGTGGKNKSRRRHKLVYRPPSTLRLFFLPSFPFLCFSVRPTSPFVVEKSVYWLSSVSSLAPAHHV